MMISMILCKFFCIQFAENESVLLGARNALPCLADIWILRQVISKHKMSRSTLKVRFICQGMSIKSKSGLQKMQKRSLSSFRPYFIHIEWKKHFYWQIKKYVPGKRTKGSFALAKRLQTSATYMLYSYLLETCWRYVICLTILVGHFPLRMKLNEFWWGT